MDQERLGPYWAATLLALREAGFSVGVDENEKTREINFLDLSVFGHTWKRIRILPGGNSASPPRRGMTRFICYLQDLRIGGVQGSIVLAAKDTLLRGDPEIIGQRVLRKVRMLMAVSASQDKRSNQCPRHREPKFVTRLCAVPAFRGPRKDYAWLCELGSCRKLSRLDDDLIREIKVLTPQKTWDQRRLVVPKIPKRPSQPQR